MNLLEQADYFNIGGRYIWQEDKLCLSYSASYLEFIVKGGTVYAKMESDEWANEADLMAWVAVFVDDEEEPRKRICLTKEERTYELFQANPEQIAKIRLMKYSENAFAKVGICEVYVEGGSPLPFTKKEQKLIEFIGDSITCGYGIEGTCNVDNFTTAQENPWEAYACRTARILGYDFSLVSWSGNGFISHYIDDSVDTPRHDKPFLQEMYPYADLELETRFGKKEYTKWNPKKSPNLIVIHVGTNDCSYTREQEARNKLYKKEYKCFVESLRAKYPNAAIICMLGVMDQRLNQTLKETVDEMKKDDRNVFFMPVPLQDEADGLGTDYHPSRITHKKVAEQLASFIQNEVLPQLI